MINDDKLTSSYETEQEYWEEYDEVKVGQLIECNLINKGDIQ